MIAPRGMGAASRRRSVPDSRSVRREARQPSDAEKDEHHRETGEHQGHKGLHSHLSTSTPSRSSLTTAMAGVRRISLSAVMMTPSVWAPTARCCFHAGPAQQARFAQDGADAVLHLTPDGHLGNHLLHDRR